MALRAGRTLRAGSTAPPEPQEAMALVPVAVPVVWSAWGPAEVPVPLLCRSQVRCPLATSPQASASKEQESSAPQGPAVSARSSSAMSPRNPSRRASKATCHQESGVRQPCILLAPGGMVGTRSSPGTAAGPWQAALPIPGAKHCPGSPVGSIPLSPPLPPFAA